MKKVIMTLVVVGMTLGRTVFAGPIDIDKRVQKAFEKEFAGAVNVKWSTAEDYVRVDFNFNNVPLIACYSINGEKLAVMRNIMFAQLPLVLQFDKKQHYKDYWISELFELVNEEGTHYYLTLENANETIRLISHEANNWEVTRKEANK